MARKPLYDWVPIRALFEQGESISDISRREGMPSKQAISQKALEEGWQRIKKVDTSDVDFIQFDGLTLDQQFIVKEIATGATQRLASAMAGHHETTVSDWKKTNPAFAQAILAAKAAKVRRRLQKIDASDDWRAAGWLMERDPDSREEFTPPSAQKAIGGHTFNVLGHVSVGLDRLPEPITQPVIEAKQD